MKLVPVPAAIAVLTAVAALAQATAAAELIPTLPCALTSTSTSTSEAQPYCLDVFNTCNTPITSTAKDAQTGEELSTSQIAKGDRGQVCGDHPLALLGHTLGGP